MLLAGQSEIKGQCRRCGACCIHSGPTLHKEDFSLLEAGIISFHDLVTIRKGDIAYHPKEKRLMELPHELIKIKGKGRSWMCRYYGDEGIGCIIYENRPIECRTFECWNSEAIEMLFMVDTLARKDIFQGGGVLEELILSYEKAFPVCRINGLVAEGIKRNEAELFMEQDDFFRKKASEALEMDGDLLDFVFGSPLRAIIERFSRLQSVPREPNCKLPRRDEYRWKQIKKDMKQ